VSAVGMFTLRLINWDDRTLDVTWSDKKTFEIGANVEVGLGYVGAVETLIVGEVTGLEPDFGASEVPTVTVRGHDPSHRLLRGRNTRSFVKMKDSDIVKQVASNSGLSVKVVDTGLKFDYVLQHNQSDMEFLQGRARRIGYELVVEGKQLHFRRPELQATPVATLARTTDLIDFRPRLTTMAQVSAVEVRGWDPATRQEIIGKADEHKVTAKMSGTTLGASATKRAFGGVGSGTIDRPVTSLKEAEQLAEGFIAGTALTYVVGDGSVVGHTKVRAGSVIRIEGVGKRFSGDYYVTSATHSYRPRHGYRTSFSVSRTAT
jgi:Bacteriophage probable baseplate hub protein